jgi:hypothetical protein
MRSLQEWDSIMTQSNNTLALGYSQSGKGEASSFATSAVGSHDSDMFSMMWSHCVNSLCVVFETTGDGKVLQKA